MSATRVLVVEDENIIAKDIADTLIKLEYEVSGIASSAEDALKNIEKNNVDLVLMDIVLKGKTDGIKAADIIRSRFHIPVIYLTAYSDEETLQRAKVTEPFGYLLKPLEERELQTTIQMALYKHKMDNAVRESEERLNKFMNSATDAFLLFDSNLNLVEINRAALELFNCERDEVIGENIQNLSPDVDLSGRYDEYLSVIETGGPLVTDEFLTHPRLGKKYLLFRAFKVGDGLGLILIDMTKRHQMEEALHRQKDMAQNYLDIAGIIILALSSKGEVVLINKKGCEVLGFDEKDILFKDWFSNFIPERIVAGARNMFKQVMEGKIPQDEKIEGVILTGRGEERIIAWNNALVKDESGKTIGTLSSGEDITDIKKAEEEVKESVVKNEEAFRVFRHKVKNNLQSLYSLISLQAHHMGEECCSDMCSDCKDRVKALSLVYDRLFRADKTVPVAARDYITDIVSHLFRSHNAGRKGLAYRVESADIGLDLNTSVPLGLMINELVSNAIRHAFPNDKKGEIWVKLEYNNNKYNLEVGDNGIGLPEGIDLKNLKTLGLELVTSLASQLDGELEVSGPGAVFRLVFPVTDDEEEK
ncbi:MAG: PAS domain S-box protein [Chloroflexi bacterium]|nr:PAS domain S-box protein [Chloroflexota bacterium]